MQDEKAGHGKAGHGSANGRGQSHSFVHLVPMNSVLCRIYLNY